MKGLVIKDLLMLKSSAKSYLIMIAVWGGIGLLNSTIGPSIMGVLPLMFVTALFAQDEKTNFDRFVRTTPVSSRNVAMARYTTILMSFALTLVICMAISFAMTLTASSDFMTNLVASMVTLAVGLLVAPVLIPMQMKFGVEKARIFSMVILVVAMMLFGGAITLLFNFGTQYAYILMACAVPVIIIEWIVSIKIAAKICKDKQF